MPFGEGGFAAVERLLERVGLLAIFARLLLGVAQNLVRLLLGFEERFFLVRLGVALGILDQARGLLFSAADGFRGETFAVRQPDGVHNSSRDDRDEDVRDEVAVYRKHA